MLLHHTLERLHELRLRGMAAALEEQLHHDAAATGLSFEDRLGLMVERELTWRDDRRLRRLLQEARLRDDASIEDVDFRAPRCLDRSVLMRLASCEWIRQHQVVLVVGPTGVGKTYLACADGSYARLLTRLARTELLILDDWGLAPLADVERRDLLEVLEDRHGRRATLITSQLPMEHWHEYLASPTLADAILDRVVHGAHKLILKGESMRKVEAARRNRESAPD